MTSMTRRDFVGLTATSFAGLALGCAEPTEPDIPFAVGGRLSVVAANPTSEAPAGLQPLGLGGARDGQIFIPARRQPGERFPLLLLFHGAGGSSGMWFGSYADRAEQARIALLAVDSRGPTWDLFWTYGPDVAFINAAIASMFDRCYIDPDRMYTAGFSDGASYSLAIGLTNGDLFSRVIAYSPGVLGGVDPHGKPKIMISHGVNDQVLHIDNTSRRFVPMLRNAGYDTSYGEFEGGHEVPSFVSDNAFTWLAAP